MPEPSDPGFLTIVNEFGSGVTLFFLLSGFSVTLSNVERVEDPGWLRGYVIKRTFRIMPLWWLMIGINLLNQYCKFGIDQNIYEIFTNIVPIFGMITGKNESLVWVEWTISAEIIFYMILSILFVFLGSKITSWISMVII